MKRLQTLKHIVLMGILIAVGLLIAVPPAHAESTQQHITITPSSSTFSIDPGATAKDSLQVINEGDAAFRVNISSSPYHVEGLNYDPQFTQLPGTVDASEWVSFTSNVDQTVEAKERLNFNYTVTVPKETAPGGYYAVIFAETRPTEGAAGVVARNRVGDILYITVKGDVKTSGSATALAIPSVITGSVTKVGAVVSNDGGVHFLSKVSSTIKNLFGATVFTSNAERYVLPATLREISVDWSPGAPIGIFHIEQTATLPSGTQNLDSKWVLVIQPWVIIALIVIIISIIIILIRRKKPTS